MADADNGEDGFVDVSKAQDGGVMKKITQEAPETASGPPPDGYEVTAHYTGKMNRGSDRFDCATFIFATHYGL